MTQRWDGATLAMLRTRLINLPLVPCVPAVAMLNVLLLNVRQQPSEFEIDEGAEKMETEKQPRQKNSNW